jgi:8-oxo-dGTP pyrophosphatase MutT (NUDIX family)
MTGLHVAVALFDSRGHVLLVHQGYGEQLWSLPGGSVEPFESPTDAAIRETHEETGYDIDIGAFIGIYAAPERDMLSLVFTGTILSTGTWHPTEEIDTVAFFPINRLPKPMSARMCQRINDAAQDLRGVYRDGTAIS